MATRDEIQRIAKAMNALRPDWRVDSLVTFLQANHGTRPYRDLATAAAVVATDPGTKTPELLNRHGAWWSAAQAAFASGATAVTNYRFERCPIPGHTSYPATNCGACRSEALQVDKVPPEIDPDTADIASRGADKARRALTEALARATETRGEDA